MRSLGWALIQQDYHSYENRDQDGHSEEPPCEDTGRNQLCVTLSLDILPPSSSPLPLPFLSPFYRETTYECLWLKPSHLRCFVMPTHADQDRGLLSERLGFSLWGPPGMASSCPWPRLSLLEAAALLPYEFSIQLLYECL